MTFESPCLRRDATSIADLTYDSALFQKTAKSRVISHTVGPRIIRELDQHCGTHDFGATAADNSAQIRVGPATVRLQLETTA
jgi:hypothetical protein